MGVLPDVLDDGLAVVFCGSAVGAASAKASAYYAGPGNLFWPTLAEVGLTPFQLAPSRYADVLKYGLGLTDFVKDQAGADASIEFKGRGRQSLARKIETHCPRLVCFNGKRAAKEFLGVSKVNYGLHARMIGSTKLFVAPSTSGAARRWWDLDYWRELAELAQRASS